MEPSLETRPRPFVRRSYGPSRLCLLAVLACLVAAPAVAQTANRDSIADLIGRTSVAQAAAETDGTAQDKAASTQAADPRAGDETYEQARRLMSAVDAILKDTAEHRGEARKLPGSDDFIVTPLWTETREDREKKVRNLLDAALGIVTDVPIVDLQKNIEDLRREIRETEDAIVEYKEKQITAPKSGVLPSVFADTVESLQSDIEAGEQRIEDAKGQIQSLKGEIRRALSEAGIDLAPEQVELLLDSVLSNDLIRLVAAFNAAKLIDGQLGKMMAAAGDNINAARKYFAMHAALFAMLVHAQTATIEKIDTHYTPRLDAILKDIRAAQRKTRDLLKANNRPDQTRALEANRESQKLAAQAAEGYKRYLRQQREQIARARQRAAHDLSIADNTYETVEASFQLRNLMRDSAASFEAIQKLEAPTFDQIFKNEELRREFESLTRKLEVPTS